MYNVDYFIKKFEAIPEERWCTTFFNLGDRSCANGHCGVMGTTMSQNSTDESRALQSVLSALFLTLKTAYEKYIITTPVLHSEEAARINDGIVAEYQQKTPKQRILAALYDIKKSQDANTFVGEFIPVTYKKMELVSAN